MTNGESKHATPCNGGNSENLAFGDVVVAANNAQVLDSVPFGMLNYRIPEFDYPKLPTAPMTFDSYVKLDNYHLSAFNGYYGLPNGFDAGRRNEHFASLSGNSTVDGDSIAEEDEPLGPDGSIPPSNKRDPIYTAVSGLKWKAKSKKWVVRWDNPTTNRRVYKYFSGTRYGFLGAHKRAKYYLEFLNASVGKCEAPSINNPFCRRTEGPPKGKTNKGLLKRLESKRVVNNFGNGFDAIVGAGVGGGGGMNNQHLRCGTVPMDPYLGYYYPQDVNPNTNIYNGQFLNNAAFTSGFNTSNMRHGHGINADYGNKNEYAPLLAPGNNTSPFTGGANNHNNASASAGDGGNDNNNNNNNAGDSNSQSYYGNSPNTAWVLEQQQNNAAQQQREEDEKQSDYFGYI